MTAFVARRILLAVVVLWGFSLISFSLFAAEFYPLKGHPILPAYWHWLASLPSGKSLRHGLTGPIWPALGPAVAHTAVLLALTLVLVCVFAVGFASLAAATRGSVVDGFLRLCTYVGWAIPAFLLAFLLQSAVNALGGAHGLGPFPIAGWPGSCPAGIGLDAGTISPCPAAGMGLRYALNVLRYAALPAVTLSIGFVALHSRYLRSALVEALEAPYTTTARAKGLPERTVIFRHALRNSVVTFAAALGADIAAIFGAALVVDWIYRLGGMGTLFYKELDPNAPFLDGWAAEMLILVSGTFVLVAAFVGELAVVGLDPRARPR